MGLTIINQDGRVVYSLIDRSSGRQEDTAQQGREPESRGSEAQPQGENKAAADVHVEAINKELARTGVALDTVLQRYGVSSVGEMDDATYSAAMRALRSTKTRAA